MLFCSILLLESGQFNTDIDVIIGTNADEGLLVCSNVMQNPGLWPAYQERFEIGGTKTLFGIAEDSDITLEDTVFSSLKFRPLITVYLLIKVRNHSEKIKILIKSFH